MVTVKRRRKGPAATAAVAATSPLKHQEKRSRKTLDLNEVIESSDDDDDLPQQQARHGGELPSLESDSEEPLDVKKVRLAREYLEKIDQAASDDESLSAASDEDHEMLSRKLQKERQKVQGTYQRYIAESVKRSLEATALQLAKGRPAAMLDCESAAKQWVESGHVNLLRGHDLPVTCVGIQQVSGERAVSGSKDHSVILWDVEKQCKIDTIIPHWKKQDDSSSPDRGAGQVLAVACSDDNRYVAVGKRDATVSIFDIRQGKQNNAVVKTFTGHKGPVTCLTFRRDSLQLFSGSQDRCIRHYNLNEMMNMETLYGHQFAVTDIDCFRMERPVSVGRDRTARAWKLAEDTHLIFRGGAKVSSAESVSLIKDDWFLTGHEDGRLALWNVGKKKAVAMVEQAHGAVENKGNIARTVCSIASMPASDIAASGSYDGYLRLWNVKTGERLAERGLDSLYQIPVYGFINQIAFGPKAKFCVAAIGQEHRLGRWDRIPRAKNRFAIIKLHSSADASIQENDDEESYGGRIDTEAEKSSKNEDDDKSEASSASDSNSE